MSSKLPNLSPLYYGDMLCSTCGKVMKKTLKKARVGEVEAVVYTCINQETGCSYFIESDQRSSAMQKPV